MALTDEELKRMSEQKALSSVPFIKDKGELTTTIVDYKKYRGFHVNTAGSYKVYPAYVPDGGSDFVIMTFVSGQDVFMKIQNILTPGGLALTEENTGEGTEAAGDITLLGI